MIQKSIYTSPLETSHFLEISYIQSIPYSAESLTNPSSGIIKPSLQHLYKPNFSLPTQKQPQRYTVKQSSHDCYPASSYSSKPKSSSVRIMMRLEIKGLVGASIVDRRERHQGYQVATKSKNNNSNNNLIIIITKQ